jgi:hypothetical protein
MAPPPRSQQWTVEPPDDAEWFTAALPELNSILQSLVVAMTQGLTRAENSSSQKYVAQVDTAASPFPLDFNCTLPRQPEEVRLAQIRILTQNGTTSGANTCASWELVDGNKLRIYNVTGLSANTQYELVFLVT